MRLPQVSFSIARVKPVTSMGGIVKFAPRGLDLLGVGLGVVGVEPGGGLALLKDHLLIRCGSGVVVQHQLQLSAVRFRRAHGQPAKGP
jgi:hypothetical protein